MVFVPIGVSTARLRAARSITGAASAGRPQYSTCQSSGRVMQTGSPPNQAFCASVNSTAQSLVTVFFMRASTMAFSVHSLPMPGSSGVTKRPFTG